MKSMICKGCGTQFPPSIENPESCLICEDDRQYVPEGGQEWTTREELEQAHRVDIRQLGDALFDLRVVPSFAIGQRAFLILVPGGNILWDCIPLLDDATIDLINRHGGIRAIAISHPHFYSNMNAWADRFDCPVFIHASDEKWIVNRGEHVDLWNGEEKELWDAIRLINIGGHFPGSTVLHVPFLSPGGAVFCGDSFVLSPSKKHLAAMYSYPNKIPLPLAEIRRIEKRMRRVEFDTIHAWEASQSIIGDAKTVLVESLSRYR